MFGVDLILVSKAIVYVLSDVLIGCRSSAGRFKVVKGAIPHRKAESKLTEVVFTRWMLLIAQRWDTYGEPRCLHRRHTLLPSIQCTVSVVEGISWLVANVRCERR